MSTLSEMKYDGAYINGRYAGYIRRVVFAGNEEAIANILKAILTKATGKTVVELQPEKLVKEIYDINGEADAVDWEWLDLREGDLRNRLFTGKASLRLTTESQSKTYCLVVDSVVPRKLDQPGKDLYLALKSVAAECAVYCIETSTYEPYAATFNPDQAAYLYDGNDIVNLGMLDGAAIELINYVLYIRLWCGFDTNNIPLHGRPYFTRLLYRLRFDTIDGIKSELALALKNNNIPVIQLTAAKYAAYDMDRGIENELAILFELFSLPEYDTTMLTNPEFAVLLFERTTSTKDKALIATFCLAYDVTLSDEQRKEFISIVKRGKKKVFQSILLKSQANQLEGLLRNKILTVQDVEQLTSALGLPLPETCRQVLSEF